MSKVAIVGGGAAGMLAAVSAAECGHQVTVFEKNEKLGKKLFLTGKGRCNITNDSDVEGLLGQVKRNASFLYSAFYTFDSKRMMDLLEQAGLRLKTERGGRVFPASDKSSDVIRTLEKLMRDRGVRVALNAQVTGLVWEECSAGVVKKASVSQDAVCTGIRTGNGIVEADAVIVATGGLSYPSTGSTGDGYRFAKETGHHLVPLSPSLVPFDVREEYCKRLQGLSLKNVALLIKKGKKVLYHDTGELLFTHFGISGPLVLSASAELSGMEGLSALEVSIDLKPALSKEQLDKRIVRDFAECKNSFFKNSLGKLLPSKLIPVMVELSGISPEKQVNAITKEERGRLTGLLKGFPLTLVGPRGYNEAIITRGGVSVKDVNPGTMESLRMGRLYFAGEVLDLDALTGGYNLQIAWSTAWLAGQNVRNEEEDIMHSIAVDGPAGAGKSTIARLVAKKLGFIYVDTGAMYRAMALYFLRKGIGSREEERIGEACEDIRIVIEYESGEQQVLLNGENVNALIRTEEVGMMTSAISKYPKVREKLLSLQRNLAESKDVIMDGRDIGTCVLPGADLKIYLTASASERARRRCLELTEKGVACDSKKIEQDIIARDEQDMNREIAPLKQAEDAVLVDASDMTIEEVVDRVVSLYEKNNL